MRGAFAFSQDPWEPNTVMEMQLWLWDYFCSGTSCLFLLWAVFLARVALLKDQCVHQCTSVGQEAGRLTCFMGNSAAFQHDKTWGMLKWQVLLLHYSENFHFSIGKLKKLLYAFEEEFTVIVSKIKEDVHILTLIITMLSIVTVWREVLKNACYKGVRIKTHGSHWGFLELSKFTWLFF